MSSWVADATLVFLAALMAVVLGGFATRGSILAGRDPATARRVGLTVAAIAVVWLAILSALAAAGALAQWTAKPPRMPLVPVTALALVAAAMLAPRAKPLILALPRSWPVAAQSFRVGVEVAFVALYLDGRAPPQVTFEGQNFDILVGLTAPLIAGLVGSGRGKPGLVIAWNLAGLAVLANTIRTVASSWPGPLHHDWPGAPFVAAATWPVVWIPGFLAPVAVLLHVVSLRQNLALTRSTS